MEELTTSQEYAQGESSIWLCYLKRGRRWASLLEEIALQ